MRGFEGCLIRGFVRVHFENGRVVQPPFIKPRIQREHPRLLLHGYAHPFFEQYFVAGELRGIDY